LVPLTAEEVRVHTRNPRLEFVDGHPVLGVVAGLAARGYVAVNIAARVVDAIDAIVAVCRP